MDEFGGKDQPATHNSPSEEFLTRDTVHVKIVAVTQFPSVHVLDQRVVEFLQTDNVWLEVSHFACLLTQSGVRERVHNGSTEDVQ